MPEPLKELTREELKQANKEAIKEWLSDEKKMVQQSVGKWMINVFVSSLVAALGYFMLTANGWHK